MEVDFFFLYLKGLSATLACKCLYQKSTILRVTAALRLSPSIKHLSGYFSVLSTMVAVMDISSFLFVSEPITYLCAQVLR